MSDYFTGEARLKQIRGQLYPVDTSYCAEPLDIEDAKWLLAQLDLAMHLLCYGGPDAERTSETMH